MTVPRPEEEVIFSVARRLNLAEERAAYVHRACGADEALQSRLEGLLRIHAENATFLETPPAGLTMTPEIAIGARVGDYLLRDMLGEGGFSNVYLAESVRPPHDPVAVKILKPGLLSPQGAVRFAGEREALARMDHPNIAHVLDSDEFASGRPYIVMEYVRGLPITRHVESHKSSLESRLRLAIDVCDAVQHAHQKGVIHRDIKPSNVLVTMVDDVPVAKVIDFGVAKAIGEPLVESSLQTNVGQLVGTPLYMSPEQMDFSGDIDTRTDIYAIGALLYELLTGSPPFDRERLRAAGFDEMRRIVREEEPPRPSERRPELRAEYAGELDWIVMKCLEKDRTRRYASAGDLARDLRRFLANEPVEARPPSRAYRLRKWLRRNRTGAIAAVLVAAALLAGTVAAGTGWLAESRERRRANKAEAEAMDKLALADAVTSFLNDDLLLQAGSRAQADRKFEAKPDLTVREALDRAVALIGERFQDRPEIEAKIRVTAGLAYRDLGQPAKAVVQLRRAVELYRQHVGPDDPGTLSAQHNLAGALMETNQFLESIAVFEAVHARRLASLGPDHPDTLATASSLGLTYRLGGRRSEALPLLQSVLERRRRVLGPSDPETLTTMSVLATTLAESGEKQQAISMLADVHRIRKDTQGPEHFDTLRAANNLAQLHASVGNFPAAIELSGPMLEAMRRTLGPGHQLVLVAMGNRAFYLSQAGRMPEAFELYRDAAADSEKYFGANDPDTLAAKSNLGHYHRMAGELDRAIPLLEAAWKAQADRLGPTNFATLKTQGRLGHAYTAAGRAAEAIPLLEVVYAQSRHYGSLKGVGPLLVQAYRAAGRTADADKLQASLTEKK